jgi:hypothetical protein
MGRLKQLRICCSTGHEGSNMLRKLYFAASLFVIAPALAANGDSSIVPMPAERAPDSYAIYAVLMPGEPFKSLPPEQARAWAIADTTVSIADMNPAVPPDGQLQPPPDNVTAFREALHDYQVRRYEHVQLTRNFTLDRDYQLLTSDQVSEFRRSRASADANSQLQDKYAGIPGVTFFSQVFFNAGQTAALVYMNNWCANLCSAGQWVYLEKHGGQWVRRSGITSKIS